VPNRLLVQRPQIVGCAGSAPTSARQCQQRSHLGEVDGVTVTTSSSPSTTLTADVMVTNFRSSPSEASSARSSALAAIASSACSDEPTPPSLRTSSMALLAASRMACTRSHLAISAESPDSRCQKVSAKIENDAPGANTGNASSAVKLSIGAIQRSIACVMCHSAVCAERRAKDLGAVVYRRSLSTSR